jgi:hypothetical protein
MHRGGRDIGPLERQVTTALRHQSWADIVDRARVLTSAVRLTAVQSNGG